MKSYVGMAHEICPLCGKKHNECVLVDRKMRDSLEHENFVGYSLCEECQQEHDGYFTLIGLSGNPNDGTASFTGDVCHVKFEIAEKLFNIELSREFPWSFCEAEVIAMLQEMSQE